MKHKIAGLLSLFLAPVCIATQLDSTAPAHPVGSCYGGGVVFYLNKASNPPVGHRGLIAALVDVADDNFAWTLSDAPTINTSSLYFSGSDNTKLILAAVESPAADAAAKFTTAATCPTCSAWYLPAQDELATLFFESSNLVNFWNNPSCPGNAPESLPYWSSSQYHYPANITTAWSVHFGTGYVTNSPAMYPYRVRAIRSF